MANLVCIGLDLAWSLRNLSGGAVIVDGQLCEARADLSTDKCIQEWIRAWLKPGVPTVIAVDAPLRVPNQEGKRACEQQLSDKWANAHAGPYPSNRRLFKDDVRGERIVRLVQDHFGFVESDEIAAKAGTRLICEVYPHPAHVALFNRRSILKYKKKAKRSYEECWAGLEEYQSLLRGLAISDPPLLDPNGYLESDFAGKIGKALKALEDRLDAVTCAYIATYLWRYGPAGTHVYGSVAEGHILVPRVPPAPLTP